jgi:hypothetical protein
VNQVTADELISKAVKVAIKEYNKEQKADKRAKALHNTKMLLKNYEKIKSSIDEAISEESQLNESLKYDEDDGVYINSIRKSKLKSLIIISHIDRALDLTKYEYERKDMLYKYNSLYDCLINGVTFEVEAEALNTSAVTIRRWIAEITKVLSIRIFGCDGVDII